MLIAVAVVGALVTAFLIARLVVVGDSLARAGTALAESRARVEALTEENRQIADLRVSLATLTEERRQAALQMQVMKQEFQLFGGDVIGKELDEFRKQIQETQSIIAKDIQDSQDEIAREHAVLGEQIRYSTEQVSGLTRALRGEVRTQGVWGEMILEAVLERSGLRKGEEYTVQVLQQNEDGKRQRPDVLVHFPGGQRIVIDSKVSLAAFDSHVNSESTAVEAKEALRHHAACVRAHVRALASKEYFAAAGSPLDCVLLFMPIEAALAAALREDPGLTAYAMEHNVVLTTPMTLMLALRTVKNVWHVERRNQNAELIAASAGKIYDKLVMFLEDFDGIGKRLDQARDSHKAALQKLRTGRGSLLDQAEEMRKMGAKTGKLLPIAVPDEEEKSSAAGA